MASLVVIRGRLLDQIIDVAGRDVGVLSYKVRIKHHTAEVAA